MTNTIKLEVGKQYRTLETELADARAERDALKERNAALLALVEEMNDKLAHDESCFLHGSNWNDEKECTCESGKFFARIAALKGEKE